MRALLWTLVCFSVISCETTPKSRSERQPASSEGNVVIKNNQLYIDGRAQPQLYGAEIQYFRLRGGEGPNVPREVVLALWNKALDQAVKAGMNAVSFYIPWDFHEYREGKFDFDGTAEHEKYPSRDVKTFIKLIVQHGINHIMIRPGPYFNAEWGFMGFGCAPEWFHEKYPDSHMMTPEGHKTRMYGYLDPNFERYYKKWLKAVYTNVAKEYIGPGKPIHFIQLDNETNYLYASIFAHDYSPLAVKQYQQYLRDRYGTVEALNGHYRSTSLRRFEDVVPPKVPRENIAADQDWYRFHDYTMSVYLSNVRKTWEDLGVHEPDVLFTSAETYDANTNGVLPNYKLRNSPGMSGMMTVNLYPQNDIRDNSFKVDHDVKAADEAKNSYLQRREEWALGPEIQGGWFPPVEVNKDSRQQTYLSVIGHGLKAFFIYYFSEGDNFQVTWGNDKLLPIIKNITDSTPYQGVAPNQLPETFWSQYGNQVEHVASEKTFAYWGPRDIIKTGGTHTPILDFGAALGPDANPNREHPEYYQLLQDIGHKIVQPYGQFLASAVEITDPVCFVKDVESQIPSPVNGIDSNVMNSDWADALVGLLLHTGANPRIHHWGMSNRADLLDLNSCRVIVYQDNGTYSGSMAETFRQAVNNGAVLVSFLSDGLTKSVLNGGEAKCSKLPRHPLKVDGIRCRLGKGALYQVASPIYDGLQITAYSDLTDVPLRRKFMERILANASVHPQIRIVEGADRTVAFGRRNKEGTLALITVKTALNDGFSGHIRWEQADPQKLYSIVGALSGDSVEVTGSRLARTGFRVRLSGHGSEAYIVKVSGPARLPVKEKNI